MCILNFYGQLLDLIGQDLYSEVNLLCLSISSCSWRIMLTTFINSLLGIGFTMLGTRPAAHAHKCILAEQPTLHTIALQVQQLFF